MADDQELNAFAAVWAGIDEFPAQLSNQALSQVGLPVGGVPDGIYLTFGAVTPPAIYGSTPEVKQQQLASYDGKLQVRPVARVRVSREHAEELVKILNTVIGQYDEAVEAYAEQYKVDVAALAAKETEGSKSGG
ncbi:MAG: hypothetical protein ACJ72E_05390 [Marmoricola sp.]